MNFDRIFSIILLFVLPINECIQCQTNSSFTLSLNDKFVESKWTNDRKSCSVSITYAFLNELFVIDYGLAYSGEETTLYIQMELSPSYPFVYIKYDCSTNKCDQMFVRKTLANDILWMDTPNVYDNLIWTFYHDDFDEEYIDCLEKQCHSNNESCRIERSSKITAKCTDINEETRGHFELSFVYLQNRDVTSQSLSFNCDQTVCSQRENLTNAFNDANDQINKLFEKIFSFSLNNSLLNRAIKFDCKFLTVSFFFVFIYLFLKN